MRTCNNSFAFSLFLSRFKAFRSMCLAIPICFKLILYFACTASKLDALIESVFNINLFQYFRNISYLCNLGVISNNLSCFDTRNINMRKN